ncbi:MAG: PstS family phosphate ABC transporter substrate-binding protein [Ilumatobacteraceae bacterium]
MTTASAKSRIAQFFVATLVMGAAAIAIASPASAAKFGDSCKSKDAYKIEKVGSTYIRCEIVKGTSIHTTNPKLKAKFAWTKTTKAQYVLANANNETLRIDGSSTVYPLTAVAAKYFETTSKSVMGKKSVKVTVGISGTGGGFEKFCKGETDISDASRAIKSSEASNCAKGGIAYTEVLIANDGLAVVVNPKNTWAKCLTMAEMKKVWEPNSKVTKWSDIRTGFPDTSIKLFGAGTDSGTFDAFTEFVNGKGGVVRKEGVQTSEDDNVTVRGVQSDTGAMGYFGLSYAIENSKTVRAIQLDKGAGCIEPTEKTVQTYTYPMARPLYLYVKNLSITTKPAVGAFVQFYVDNLKQISTDALFVPLTNKQIKTLKAEMAKIAKLPRVSK